MKFKLLTCLGVLILEGFILYFASYIGFGA